MSKKQIIILALILLSFAVGIYFYPQMPERMASHWNARGQVDGYISRFWGVFLMPFITAGMAVLFLIIPRIDPLQTNVAEFRSYFEGFVLLLVLFLFYLYILTIIWNLGTTFDMTRMITPAFAVIFYYAGVLIEKSKRNWFIGIRTPWTLSSDKVWDKTHAIGGKLFKLVGLLSLLGILFPNYTIFFMLIPALAASLFTVIYSYVIYQKEVKV